jgi:hypothetical protein
MERRSFKLPHICGCGARGEITYEEGDLREPGELHPQVKMAAVEGPFRLGGQHGIVCLNCETLAKAPKT